MFNTMHTKIRRDGTIASLVLAGLVLAAGSASAVPQLMATFGDQMPWVGAEANAMGGTMIGVYRGGLSTGFNPALLADADNYRLDAGAMLDQEHEDRYQPLFDTFDSYVVDATIASNRQHYWQAGFGFAAPVRAVDFPVSIGISLTDRYPFDYTFEEELYNPSPFPPAQGEPARDALIEERMREVSGTLRYVSFGAGAQLTERLAFGAALNYATGDHNEVWSVRDYITTDGDDGYRYEQAFDMSGMNVTLGLRGRVDERLELAVAWESALTVDGDRDETMADALGMDSTSEDAEIKYPQMFRAGLVFRPRTDPLTVFTLEAEYKPWSELEDSRMPGDDNPLNLNDVTEVRIGLEHLFYNGIPLRFGFRHLDSYSAAEASISAFSAGVGAPVGGGMVSASLELTKLSALVWNQFDYPTDYFGDNFVAQDYARVEDTRFRVGLAYKVEF